MDLFDGHIPLLRPWVDEAESEAVLEVLRSGWLSQGPRVTEFERRVAELVGAPHCVAVNSATSALHLAFLAAGVRPGMKAIVPSHTCMATVNGLILAGGVPVFADIEADTFNLDPAAVESTLAEHPGGIGGIVLVHQVGLPADIDAFREIARRHGVFLVEDAATAFGARYHGRCLGGHGQTAVYSFHPRKMITTGEGGMAVFWDSAHAERAARLRSAGASVSDLARHEARGTCQQDYPEPGFNYRMTDMQAAIGIAQLGKLDRMLAERAAQAACYGGRFRDTEEVRPPHVPEGRVHSYSSYCVSIPNATESAISDILAGMAARGISCRRGIQPLHWEPYFRPGHGHLCLPRTEQAARETLFLPIFPGLRPEQQKHVADSLLAVVRGK